MFLKQLNLTNFRNYSQINFEFNNLVTVLVGNNAQGKSNFLESIYFLSTTKSHRAERDEELIKKNEEVLRVESLVEGVEGEINLEIAIQKQEGLLLTKRVRVNGITKRVLDYIGNLAVIIFSPEDLNLVTSSPSLRRWHIDLTLAQIDKDYKKSLTSYEEVVKNKNRLLKKIREGEARIEELDFWIDEQIKFGEIVSSKRREFFLFLNKTEKKFDSFTFQYLESVINKERINEYKNREVAASNSLIGPHRDDFKFLTGKDNQLRDLAKFGSRGEQRTAVLDLKIAEVAFMEQILGSRPMLLLDEVFSELDIDHRKHVLGLIKLQQTIIATVEFDDFLKKQLKGAKILNVENGMLSEIVEK